MSKWRRIQRMYISDHRAVISSECGPSTIGMNLVIHDCFTECLVQLRRHLAAVIQAQHMADFMAQHFSESRQILHAGTSMLQDDVASGALVKLAGCNSTAPASIRKLPRDSKCPSSSAQNSG